MTPKRLQNCQTLKCYVCRHSHIWLCGFVQKKKTRKTPLETCKQNAACHSNLKINISYNRNASINSVLYSKGPAKSTDNTTVQKLMQKRHNGYLLQCTIGYIFVLIACSSDLKRLKSKRQFKTPVRENIPTSSTLYAGLINN